MVSPSPSPSPSRCSFFFTCTAHLSLGRASLFKPDAVGQLEIVERFQFWFLSLLMYQICDFGFGSRVWILENENFCDLCCYGLFWLLILGSSLLE